MAVARSGVGGSISTAVESMTREGVILFAMRAVSLAAMAREEALATAHPPQCAGRSRKFYKIHRRAMTRLDLADRLATAALNSGCTRLTKFSSGIKERTSSPTDPDTGVCSSATEWGAFARVRHRKWRKDPCGDLE